MRPHSLLLVILLTIAGSVSAQAPKDSTFSLIFSNSISYTHASDPHINRWLAKYSYPAEPRLPANINIEIAAIPASSHFLYSLKVSTIVSARNLTSINVLGGFYGAIVKNRSLLVFAGFGAGYHADMITLNGNMPADYKALATQYNRQLSLHRTGLLVEPSVRAFWYALHYHNLQLGLFAALGYDMDFNSHWKLGYYENRGGKYSHFKKIKNPVDQQRVSEYGLSYNAGLSLRIRLH
jgi:hypothetical protein